MKMSYFTSTRFRPVCPSCGKELGHLEEAYKRLIEQGKTRKEAMDTLGIVNFCCRSRTMCPIVLPLGGHYLPRHERSMEEYLQIKEKPSMSNLVIVSLIKSVNGETRIVSRVNQQGFIGVAETSAHEPHEIILDRDLEGECPIRILNEPGDITRGITFESRRLRRDIDIDHAESYFDLPVEKVAEVDLGRMESDNESGGLSDDG
jgi:DNA-directed RNA polymerase subunit N (RpoN/RPB10)